MQLDQPNQGRGYFFNTSKKAYIVACFAWTPWVFKNKNLILKALPHAA